MASLGSSNHNLNSVLLEVKRVFSKKEREKEKGLIGVGTIAMEKLVEFSPVDTGLYRSNHFLNTSITPSSETNNQISPPQDAINREVAKLKSGIFKRVQNFSIANNLPYTDNVEFKGWALTPPYQTYAKAKQYVESVYRKEFLDYQKDVKI